MSGLESRSPSNASGAASSGPEARYRALIESAQPVVWRMDAPTMQVTYVSREAEKLLGFPVDQTARHRADALLAGDLKILEMIAAGNPLTQILDTLTLIVEDQADGMIGSVLFLEDGVRVRHAAGPSLPAAYAKAIDGEPIGPDRGSCGTAAHRREPVIVEDIDTDPLWDLYRPLARSFGFRSCWSFPIKAHDRTVLGTFALYSPRPQRPSAELMELVQHASHLAAIAIERHRRVESLIESESFARSIVDHALDANVIMDLDGTITGWSSRAVEI